MTRIHCPHCGYETVRIIYGYPVMDDKLQKDVNEQRVYLAGCEKMIPPASRHCFYCDKDVCYSFLPVDEANTTSVEFEIGGFHEGYQKIVVKKTRGRFIASYSDSIGSLEYETSIDLTEKEYKKFIHNVFMSYIKEWDGNYDDPDICDGTSWSIIIKQVHSKQEWSGINKYPPLWNRFIKAINSLGLPELR